MLFAAREAIQESLDFSHLQLVFGHTPRDPVKSLQESFLSFSPSPPSNVLDYISQFRERLHRANSFAKQSLSSTQKTMKCRYDRSAVTHNLHMGDKVLVLLPIAGSALSARFAGPYEVLERLSDTDYLI